MKTALVLEGGAMRGLYTAGVLDIFLDHNIEVDAIYGTSAGVLFGVNFLSKQRGRALRYNKRFARDPHYMGIWSLITTGNVINKDFAYYDIPFNIDVFDQEAYARSKTKFIATMTNVETGETEYAQITNVLEQMETLRATSALPYVSHMVEINQQHYLDGGLSDSLPIRKCLSDGYEKVVVVLTRPEGFRIKEPINAIANLFYHKHPKLAEAINKRYITYNNDLSYIEQLYSEGKIELLRPSKEIKMRRIESDTNKLQAIYDLGTQDASASIEQIKQYLSK